MKNYIKIILLIITALLPAISFAADCVPKSGFIPSDACIAANGFGAFAVMINTIINWFVTISVSVAAITFAYAGAQMLLHPSEEGKRTEAKEMFRKTIVGMFIILGAWLVIHTIIGAIVDPTTGALRFLKS